MIYLIIASVFWAFSFGLIKQYLTTLDPFFVAWARLAIALPCFLPFFRIRSLTLPLIIQLLLIGAIEYGGTYTAYLYSYKYLESYQIALFLVLTPIYVTLIDNIYKRKLRWVNLLLACFAAIGGAIIEYRGLARSDLVSGLFLLQVANICFAFGQVAYRELRRKHEELVDKEVYALLFMGAVVITTIATSFNGGWESFSLLGSEQILVLAYLGALATGLGFFFWNVGALKTTAGVLAVMNNVKIPLAVAVSLTFFGEKTDVIRLIFGGGIMLFSVLVAEWYRNREPK